MEGMDPHPKAISCRSFLFCQQTQGNNTPLLSFPARAFFFPGLGTVDSQADTLNLPNSLQDMLFKSRALQET